MRCKPCRYSAKCAPDIFLTSNAARLKNGACDHVLRTRLLIKPDITPQGILTYQQITPDKRVVTMNAFFNQKITKEE